MINQEALPSYLKKAMPELSDICVRAHCDNEYDIVRQIMQFTKDKASEHNIPAVSQCLSVVDNLYTKGNTAIRHAIENVFVYSFSHAFFHNERDREQLVQIVPHNLYKLYKKQVINSHL